MTCTGYWPLSATAAFTTAPPSSTQAGGVSDQPPIRSIRTGHVTQTLDFRSIPDQPLVIDEVQQLGQADAGKRLSRVKEIPEDLVDGADGPESRIPLP